jgi:hypothetical protein
MVMGFNTRRTATSASGQFDRSPGSGHGCIVWDNGEHAEQYIATSLVP